jgi:F-type H+-transporting ATPase subunit delta
MAERATIARPYARAAFAYAKEQGWLAQWSQWLARARDTVASEEYQRLQHARRMRTGELTDLIAGVAGDALDVQGRAFLDLLAENGRVGYLPEIAAQFEELVAADENVADVEVVSAVPLDARQTERLAGALRGRLRREVRLHCRTDASLIGGAIVRSGDLLIDGSLRGKLARLETELTS